MTKNARFALAFFLLPVVSVSQTPDPQLPVLTVNEAMEMPSRNVSVTAVPSIWKKLDFSASQLRKLHAFLQNVFA
jgi:hypothetical protein